MEHILKFISEHYPEMGGVIILALIIYMIVKQTHSFQDIKDEMKSSNEKFEGKLDVVKGQIDVVKEQIVLVKEQIVAVEKNLTDKIDNVDQKLTDKIDNVDQKLTAKIDTLDLKIDTVEYNLLAQIKLEGQI